MPFSFKRINLASITKGVILALKVDLQAQLSHSFSTVLPGIQRGWFIDTN